MIPNATPKSREQRIWVSVPTVQRLMPHRLAPDGQASARKNSREVLLELLAPVFLGMTARARGDEQVLIVRISIPGRDRLRRFLVMKSRGLGGSIDDQRVRGERRCLLLMLFNGTNMRRQIGEAYTS